MCPNSGDCDGDVTNVCPPKWKTDETIKGEVEKT